MNAASLSREEAAVLTETIRGHVIDVMVNVEAIGELLDRARSHRAYEVLGYETFPAYVEAELGGVLRGLDRVLRRDQMRVLAELGLATRTIAKVVEVSQSTVSRELRGESLDSAVVVGRDGKKYARPAQEAGNAAPTGGRSQEGDHVPSSPRRKDLVGAYTSAVHDLRRIVERFEKIHADDRFARHHDSLGSRAGFLREMSDRLLRLARQLDPQSAGVLTVHGEVLEESDG